MLTRPAGTPISAASPYTSNLPFGSGQPARSPSLLTGQAKIPEWQLAKPATTPAAVTPLEQSGVLVEAEKKTENDDDIEITIH